MIILSGQVHCIIEILPRRTIRPLDVAIAVFMSFVDKRESIIFIVYVCVELHVLYHVQ